MNRYVVVGAGAVGGTIAARLSEHGGDVVVVARGRHGAAIRSEGLTVHDPDRSTTVALRCASHPSEVDWRGGEIVVLATKTHDAATALDDVALHAPDATVVCATNGIEAERLALRRFARTYGMSVMMAATHLEPGHVIVHHAPLSGVFDIGRYPTGTDDASAAVAAALCSSSFDCAEHDDVMQIKRGKLLVNLRNALDALCGVECDTTSLQQVARDEGAAAFDAAGLAHSFSDPARFESIAAMRAAGGVSWSGGSTAQSLKRGTGRTEVDALNGEIVLTGRTHAVPVPLNELLQRLVRRAAAGSDRVQLAPDEVISMLEGARAGLSLPGAVEG